MKEQFVTELTYSVVLTDVFNQQLISFVLLVSLNKEKKHL